jgi:hypothetical protein
MRTACQHLLRAHRVLPKALTSITSRVQIVTPFNLLAC